MGVAINYCVQNALVSGKKKKHFSITPQSPKTLQLWGC